MHERTAERFRENAVGIASTVVTGTWLAMLFLIPDSMAWLAFLLFGYIVIVPVTAMLFGDEEEMEEWVDEYDGEVSTPRDDDSHPRDALETLRTRYARGDLTDEQFERKLDRLLETETLEDVEDRQRRKERDVEFEH
ncbi:SHOCT domain-containing protein [Natranaeroarchaeum sulfidigenes]|uniref:Putative membrane protein n=1 Tax=Natranaeroarchaeum sulfidigenes TaxID=2784880 RepID=A0A897MSP8_9EURY|nr:SHOCT domain-containing protein [Natranaeroarchaeum sulfidigenes]QSG02043.1 putative membrane protein [Natranaeroarchaeum sulfidigenes]